MDKGEKKKEETKKKKKKTDAGEALSVPQSILPCTRGRRLMHFQISLILRCIMSRGANE